MRADILKALLGDKLIGKRITTEPMGEYPGGIATVIDLGHDPNAPEIVLNVALPGWGEIGVFDHENVTVFQPPQTAMTFGSMDQAARIFRKRGRPN